MAKLNCFEFGSRLVKSKDLDPVYVLLTNIRWSEDRLRKWLLAYWCYYDVGTASWVADKGDDFWRRMQDADKRKYPRGRERRHFRADNSETSLEYLQERGLDWLYDYALQDVVDNWVTAYEVIQRVRQWVGFGPWIAFKVADMLDACSFASVDFDVRSCSFYDTPQKGAEALREELQTDVEDVTEWAVELILDKLSDLGCPHSDRELRTQEAETILCKWKSYLNGSYRIGEDTEALRKSLAKFPDVPTVEALYTAGKRGGLWRG